MCKKKSKRLQPVYNRIILSEASISKILFVSIWGMLCYCRMSKKCCSDIRALLCQGTLIQQRFFGMRRYDQLCNNYVPMWHRSAIAPIFATFTTNQQTRSWNAGLCKSQESFIYNSYHSRHSYPTKVRALELQNCKVGIVGKV